MSGQSAAWSNDSVLAFAAGADPMDRAREVAGRLTAIARERNLHGPPMDVLGLARAVGLHVRAINDVADARIVPYRPATGIDPAPGGEPHDPFPDGTAGLTIDYNPSRPRGRLRFSIAHELAHACFPGVADQVRHRTPTGAVATPEGDNDWELELLCNVIASELVLPNEAVAGLVDIGTDIDFIMETRRRWDVSIEALLRRLTHAVPRRMTMLAVSRTVDNGGQAARLDYIDTSPSTPADSPLRTLHHGQLLPWAELLLRCVAVGQTVRGDVQVGVGTYAAQCVGAPPYPGGRFPRILALLEDADHTDRHPGITYITGDLLDIEVDTRPLVFAHVVSDAAHAWGRRGVAATLSTAFPDAARAFRSWSIADGEHLSLGRIHAVEQNLRGADVTVVSMVAQHGYGADAVTRLRYDALACCLSAVATLAERSGGHVHLPRIGAGQAGGRWNVVADLIHEHLVSRGVAVTVHTKPTLRAPTRR